MKTLFRYTFIFLVPLFALFTGAAWPVHHGNATEKQASKAPDGVERSGAYGEFLRGVLAEKSGDYPSAILHYEKAARLDAASAYSRRKAAGLRLRVGDIDKAESTALTCASVDPEDMECLDILAGIYTSQGKYEKAAGYLEKMMALKPDDINTIVALAIVHLELKEPKKAISLLEGAPESGSHFFIYDKYFLGRAYAELGDFSAAAEKYESIFKKSPDFSVVMENLGWVYRMTGQWDKAVDLYRKYLVINSTDLKIQIALEKALSELESGKTVAEQVAQIALDKPQEIDFRLFLGLTKWRQGELTRDPTLFHDALKQFQLVRAGDLDNQSVIFYIGSIFESLNLLAESISAWKQIAPANDSEEKTVNLKIADLYERKGDFKNSLKYSLAAMKLFPEDPELIFLAGYISGKLNKHQDSVKYFKKSLELNPNNSNYYFYLGVSYEKLTRYDDCIEAMKKAIDLKPDHSNALNYLGYIYAEQDINLDEAEKYIMLAIELEPDNGYFIDSLGWIYYKQKKYSKALKHILQASRNITPDPTVLDHLGDVYNAMGRHKDAADAYQRSVDAKVYDDRVIDREAIRKKLEQVKKLLGKRNGG